ncbi:MAG: hypothetical protein J6S20_04800 [Paludibacteraceae bacterium]|nr:hypothetical protein [Paludibacteraceae bacterium]
MKNKLKTGSISIEEFIDNFGLLNKTDYEVLVFKELLKDNPNTTNYEFSRQLKLPVSKIKRLREEVVLRYEERNEQFYQVQFVSLLKTKSDFNGKDEVRIQVEDADMRNYLLAILSEKNIISDTSFSRDILRIKKNDFFTLLTDVFEEDFKEDASKLGFSTTSDKDNEWKKLLVDAIIEIVIKKITNSDSAVQLAKLGCNKLVDWIHKTFE